MDEDEASDRGEDYSSYGSGESDEELDANSPGSSGRGVKFQRIVSSLEDCAGSGAQLAGLTELCEELSFCTEDSIRSFPTDTALPLLVGLAGSDGSPEIMLLAVRAVAYLCDAMPRYSDAIVRHGALPVICSRLFAIEYLDVAEQCLQALEKISQRQPVPCLQAGAIKAVLAYIDFFSTSIQRVALSTVANICRKLPLDCSSLVMDSIPTLCNLLQYEDRKIVETVATCLIRITECFSGSSELLDELCKHGLISRAVHLIAIDGRTSLSEATYTGLIGLLTKLATKSVVAVRTLFELNASSSLRTILSASGVSRGTPYSSLEDSHSNQVNEVLKLLNQLIPPLTRDNEDMLLVLAKEKIIVDQPEFLHQFAVDILPVSIQVVISGANLHVCYGCVSIINNIVYFSTPDLLLNLLKNTNISSLLAGLLARKDHHVLGLTLGIIESLMRKLPSVFSSSFVKEGVIYAIDALLSLESSSYPRAQESCQTQLPDNQATRNVPRCLCNAFDSPSSSSSEAKACRLGKDTVHMLAKHIKATYFTNDSIDSDICLTEVLKKLKIYCAVLNDNVDRFSTNDGCSSNEEYLSHVLEQVMSEVNGGDTMSTFEFIESGIVKSLAHYLCNGKYLQGSPHNYDLPNNCLAVLKRFHTFASISLSKVGQNWEEMLLTLVRKLQNALSSSDNFPVIFSHVSKPRNTHADIPVGRSTMQPCLKVRFLREEGVTNLTDYDGILSVGFSSSLDAIEKYLWPKISKNNNEQTESAANTISETEERNYQEMAVRTIPEPSISSSLEGVVIEEREPLPVDSSKKPRELITETISNLSSTDDGRAEGRSSASQKNGDARLKLSFSLKGKELDHSLTLYQAILDDQISAEPDIIVGPKLWNEVHQVTYKRAGDPKPTDSEMSYDAFQSAHFPDITGFSWQKLSFFSSMLLAELPCKLDKSNPSYDMLFMLKILEGLNRFSFHLLSYERSNAFAEGSIDNFDDLKVVVSSVPQSEFMNSKLTDKLEQQLRDPLASTTGSMPSWCSQLMAVCPFLFSFEAKKKYLCLTTFGSSRIQHNEMEHLNSSNTNSVNDRRSPSGPFPRKKFKVNRSNVLESAAKMMASHACNKAVIEVEYDEEVGTGIGPTVEFYTLVSHEFQKIGLGMWRGDHNPCIQSGIGEVVGDYGFVVAPFGLFPRPWSVATSVSTWIQFSEVKNFFFLLGQLVAKAIKDGRILDMPFSRAFYKVILEQELGIYDIQSFDPELGRTLLEFQALIYKKKYLESKSSKSSMDAFDLCFRNMRIEDLCLDFTLPGYSDYVLSDLKTVNIANLEEYISLVVDATIKSGISRQVEAFKSGFNEVFPLKALQNFTEDELARLLSGEHNTWDFSELLDHIKFDHGYTASSPPAISLLEIMQEFGYDQRRAFLQFVTGAPRLPPGGLAALNPKLTIVRKHCSNDTDTDLPSVMTCANYLKLPPYSSKERMRQRLLYAIEEGQGSFHLS